MTKKIFTAIWMMVADAAFGESYSLERALQQALSGNPESRMASIETAVAKARARQALSAYFPSISAYTGYTYLSDYPKMELYAPPMIDKTISLGDNNNYASGLQAGYTLYSGGADTARYQASRDYQNAAKFREEDAKAKTFFATRAYFYRLLFLEKSSLLAREALKRARAREAEASAKYAQGALPQVEFLASRTWSANQEFLVREAERHLDEARSEFRVLLALPPGADLEILGNLENGNLPPNLPEDITTPALVLAREALRKASAHNETATLAGFFPRITTSAKYEYMKPHQLQVEYGDLFTFNVQATLPLFSGGEKIAMLDAARAQTRLAEVESAATKSRIAEKIFLLQKHYRDLHAGLSLRKENIERAREAYHAMEASWKIGATTSRELSDYELDVFRAETDYYKDLAEIYSIAAEYEATASITTGIFSTEEKNEHQ